MKTARSTVVGRGTTRIYIMIHDHFGRAPAPFKNNSGYDFSGSLASLKEPEPFHNCLTKRFFLCFLEWCVGRMYERPVQAKFLVI